ncbi:hypothetical protein BJF85_00385 [Saccharomonospora sp. CUA-673]|uniref:phosphatase PAP2 family protein n=1 Tax=Saccharomonospora sp. CUA-673 TaxID=1904969 RepID=UPI00095F93C0|nr:phosphatase PAP2 family protein [Saccharomonospora sp. CUA-673]OLT46960.1 hypothetical protein BJF85_00385 [Saccharomonospora sp. CUA-673]
MLSQLRSEPRTGVLATAGALLAAFVALGLFARNGTDLDLRISDALADTWQGPVGTVAGFLSLVLGPYLPIAAAVALAIAAAVDWRRDRLRAQLFGRVLIVLVACRLTTVVTKPLFGRERPREYPDLAFPSGHTTSVAATGFAAILLVAWLIPRLLRTTIVVTVLATIVIAACRIVLDVHWLTDTIGAVLVVTGVGLVTAVLTGLIPLPGRPTGVQSRS